MNVKYWLAETGPQCCFPLRRARIQRRDSAEVKELLWMLAKVIQIEISSLFVIWICSALWDLLQGWALRADGAMGVAARCRGVGPHGL